MSLFKKTAPRPPEERWLRYQQEVENVAKMCGHSDIMSWPPLSTIRNHVKHLESELAALREENARLHAENSEWRERWHPVHNTLRADLSDAKSDSEALRAALTGSREELIQLRADLDRAITLLRGALKYRLYPSAVYDEIEKFLKDHATKEATNNG